MRINTLRHCLENQLDLTPVCTLRATITMIADTRTCCHCNSPIRGRTDKKFCNDFCRNQYNTLANLQRNTYIRQINLYLRKNRRILEKSLPAGKKSITLPRKWLVNKGFRFAYCTSAYLDSKGKLFHFCYEFGYLRMGTEEIRVVKKNQLPEEEDN